MRRTLVVLPTYLEADNLEEVLRRLRAAVPAADVLVIDDSSPDGTAQVAKAVGEELGRVEVWVRPGKAGLGSAYRDGFRQGLTRGYEVLVEMDSDLSHDPAALPALIAAIDQGAALVIGSRYVPGGRIPNWSLYRRLLSRFGNRYAARLLRLDVADATSGFRAYDGATLGRLDLSAVRADGYGFQIEMAHRISRLGGGVVELPIDFVERHRGTSKMSLPIVIEAFVLVTRRGLGQRLQSVVRAISRTTPRAAFGRRVTPVGADRVQCSGTGNVPLHLSGKDAPLR
ncbi:MAG: polyprenol monophosphomannose synthase [Actinobacteria bacterium]|nr:polyprenol monophosphomannose synthase [Actinomycetota bacterium]